MPNIFTSVGAEIIAAVLIVLVLFNWWIGFILGRRHARVVSDDAAGQGKIAEACLAIMGLLLAFCFATAYTKFEARRIMEVNEANAIGTFAIRAQLLPEASATVVKRDLTDYVRMHLEIVRTKFDRPRQIALDRQMVALQGDIQGLVLRALDDPAYRMLAVPLLASMNDMFDRYEDRAAVLRDHVPTTVVMLLVAVCLTSSSLLGRSQGMTLKQPPFITLVFLLLVVFIIYVTLDLDQPWHGLAQTSQITMERLARGMGIDVASLNAK